MAGLGRAMRGEARRGEAGVAWLVWEGRVRAGRGPVWQARHGVALLGSAQRGRYGVAWPGKAGPGLAGQARRSKAGEARSGWARHGTARHVRAGTEQPTPYRVGLKGQGGRRRWRLQCDGS
jgi:hypothetical protein